MSKRFLAGMVSLLAIATMFLAACGGGSTSTTAPNTGAINYSGTITIWHNWAGNYLAEKQKLFNDYMTLHPGVKIVLINQSDLTNKSIAAVKAGVGPDIIAWVDDQLGTLAATNTVIPLDSYLPKSYIDSTYAPAAAQGVEYNGHVYGVPESVEAVTIMYNKALVTADQLPKTTDDMLTFEKNYEAAHPGQYGIVWDPTNAYYNAAFFYGFGGFFVKADGSVGLNTTGGLAAGQYLSQYRTLLPQDVTNGSLAGTLFSQGKAAMIIDGPWAYNNYTQPPANINVGFLTLPATPNGPATPFVGVKSLWVSKLSQNVPLDVDLMKFYTDQANQVEMAQKNSEIPANLAAEKDPAVLALPSVGGFAAQAQTGVPLPNTPYMGQLWGPTATALTDIFKGTLSATDALNQAQQAATQAIQNLNG